MRFAVGEFESRVLGSKTIVPGTSDAPIFWSAVSAALAKQCLAPGSSTFSAATAGKDDQIQALTLCAMQKALGADLAMLQKRDFFTILPAAAQDITAKSTQLQEILERIIWKGDFLTTIHVPGSVLVQVMQQSKKYKADDASALSLSDEQGRELVALGMKYDSDRGEYLNQWCAARWQAALRRRNQRLHRRR